MKYKIFLLKLLLVYFYILPVKANFDIKASTAILQDYHSGQILYEKYPNERIYPASMTKIMTTIIAFELIEIGDLSLDVKFSCDLDLIRLKLLSKSNNRFEIATATRIAS